MAFYRKKRRSFKKDKYSMGEKIAYHLGKIENVIKSNKDCRVRDSYLNGKNGKRDKKSMY